MLEVLTVLRDLKQQVAERVCLAALFATRVSRDAPPQQSAHVQIRLLAAQIPPDVFRDVSRVHGNVFVVL